MVVLPRLRGPLLIGAGALGSALVIWAAADRLAAALLRHWQPQLEQSLSTLVAQPVLRRFKQRVDHRRYNGAALLGLRGLVFKSHGSADAFAFENALHRAYDAARNRLLERVERRVALNVAAGAAAPAATAGLVAPAVTPGVGSGVAS